MKTNEFYAKLNESMNQISNEFRYINYGGCGLFALMLADEYIKRGIPIRFSVMMSINGYGHEHINKCTRTFRSRDVDITSLTHLNRQHSIYCSHVMLKAEGYLIDDSGVYNKPPNNFAVIGEIDYFTLEGWTKETDVWNYRFKDEHGKDIDKIKKLVQKSFV